MRRFLSLTLLLLLSGCAPNLHSIKILDDGVCFTLRKPDVDNVLFVSSSDGYRLRPMQRDEKGIGLLLSRIQKNSTIFIW